MLTCVENSSSFVDRKFLGNSLFVEKLLLLLLIGNFFKTPIESSDHYILHLKIYSGAQTIIIPYLKVSHFKTTHRWHHHHHHRLLLLQPFLLHRGSTTFFLALEEKILAIPLWAIFTRLWSKKVSSLIRTTKHFHEANRSTQLS